MTEKQERNIYTHVCFASIISGIAILLSIIALFIWKCNYKPMSWDFANSIIAILSILVTVLIGWNIYTLIDLKELSKKTKDMEENFSKTLDSKITELNNSIKVDMVGVSTVLFGVSMNVDNDLPDKIIDACKTYTKIKGCGAISSLFSFKIILLLLSYRQLSDNEIGNIASGLDEDVVVNILYDLKSHKSDDIIKKAINNMEKILSEKFK